MVPLVLEILHSRGGGNKNKLKIAIFSLGESILLLLADKCNERSSNPNSGIGRVFLNKSNVIFATELERMICHMPITYTWVIKGHNNWHLLH